MVISACDHREYIKNGVNKSGATRFRCKLCGKSWTEFTSAFEGMRVGMDLAVQIITLLCEGNSIASTSRITGAYKQTIIDLLILVGSRCERYMENRFKNLPVDDVQADEIWQFIYCKKATAKQQKYVGGCGDSFCYTAVERNTKLLICGHLGQRNEPNTHEFCRKLDEATAGEFQLSTDGWQPYPYAVFRRIGHRAHDGVVIKNYSEPTAEDRRKYSPSRIINMTKRVALGNPDMDKVCTSHAERMNGSIRTFCKRMARLTYSFSKKWGNHHAALGLFFAHYNFCRKHRTLGRMTPAMAHGLEAHIWTVRQLIETVINVKHF